MSSIGYSLVEGIEPKVVGLKRSRKGSSTQMSLWIRTVEKVISKRVCEREKCENGQGLEVVMGEK